MLAGLPDEGAITLPVGWLRGLLRTDAPPEQRTDLTVAEMAGELGRATSTVRGWLGKGLLPEAYRLHGREWRVPRTAFQEFIDRERRGGGVRRTRDEDCQAVDLSAWRRQSAG